MDIVQEIKNTENTLLAMINRDIVMRILDKDKEGKQVYKDLYFLYDMPEKEAIVWVFKNIYMYDRLTEMYPGQTLGPGVNEATKCLYSKGLREMLDKQKNEGS